MRKLLMRLRPDCFEDLIAVLALYRPGPLESGMIDMFIRRKHGQEAVTYQHEVLRGAGSSRTPTGASSTRSR
jgi:DNA polymerase-3 subunit alpha